MANTINQKINLGVLGSTGLKQHSGYIDEEFLHLLRGTNGVRIYREMSSNNSVIGAILFIIDMVVRRSEWRIETQPGMEDNETAIKEKEFIEECLGDMSHSFEDLISEILSMLIYGWSYFETTYKIRKGSTLNPQTRSKYSDGRFGWRKIEIRAQDTLLRWLFNKEGDLLGIEQQDTYNTNKGVVQIPIEKSILFKTKSTKGNPEGKSFLRPAVRDWMFLKRLQEIEAIGIERDLAGMPIFEVPQELLLEDASASDQALRACLETMIQQVRVDERWGGLIPSELDREGKPTGYKFKLMTTGGKRMIDTNAIIKRYESRIAMVFLAEFIMIGMDKVGTQSLHEGKSSMFKLALETILNDMIAPAFNKYGIGNLERLNNVPQEYWPIIKPADLDQPDLEKMGKYITSLAQSGILSPNQALENKLLSDAKLPIPDNEGSMFEDPTIPTPKDATDQASGVLSTSQIETIMNLNRAIKAGDMTKIAAKELAAVALSMDANAVDKFLIDEPTGA